MEKRLKITNTKKKTHRFFGGKEKSCNFASRFGKRGAKTFTQQRILGYGVMVTRQILVLLFLVRVQVSQHQEALQDILARPLSLSEIYL